MFKRILIFLIICHLNVQVMAQSKQISVRFIGNCGLHLTDGTTNFYIDFPYKSGAHNYMEYDATEVQNVKSNSIFIFTHRHADHYSKRLWKKHRGQKFDPYNTEKLEQLSKEIPEFSIQSFRTPHKVFGISFKHYSYLITWHGKKIYLSGDTESADTFAKQENLDYAFVPIWLLLDANDKNIKSRSISKKIYVYHIGPKDQIKLKSDDTQISLLNKQGEVIIIEL
jgi:L-ascorbate metabolism protein UlaG (beta-lactamase superfamily)